MYFIYIWIIRSFENTHPSFLHVMLTTSWGWAVIDPFRWCLRLLALNHPHISDMSGLLFTHLCNLFVYILMPHARDGLQGSQCLAGAGAGCWPLCHYLRGRQEWRQEMRKGKAGVLQGKSLTRKAWSTRTSMSTPGITRGKTHNCTLCVAGISRLWLNGLELKPWFTKLEAGCAYGL